MKKFLILLVTVAVTTILLVGCAVGVKTYTDSGQPVNVSVNQKFVIALDSNPTTGYSWQESYDKTMLELEEKTYKLGAEAKQGAVGAGGVEYFRFTALKAGKTEITMVYKRPWEEEIAEQQVFNVNIK